MKTLDQFDFAFQPTIKREQVESLHERGFLDRRENVVLLGPPGGHSSIDTTNIYAEVNLKMKAAAMALCDVAEPDPGRHWEDKDLMAFLNSY